MRFLQVMYLDGLSSFKSLLSLFSFYHQLHLHDMICWLSLSLTLTLIQSTLGLHMSLDPYHDSGKTLFARQSSKDSFVGRTCNPAASAPRDQTDGCGQNGKLLVLLFELR